MNRRLLDATGGRFLFGVRDIDRIEYLTAIVQDSATLPKIWDKAAMYLHRLARSQAFIDVKTRNLVNRLGSGLRRHCLRKGMSN
jgi:hypothetical protein